MLVASKQFSRSQGLSRFPIWILARFEAISSRMTSVFGWFSLRLCYCKGLNFFYILFDLYGNALYVERNAVTQLGKSMLQSS